MSLSRSRVLPQAFTPSRGSDLVGAHDPGPDGVAHEPRNVVDAQTLHELGPMRLDRLGAQAQTRGDLLGAMPLRDELEYFPLARRQRGHRLDAFLADATHVRGQDVPRDGGAQVAAAVRHRAEGRLQL